VDSIAEPITFDSVCVRLDGDLELVAEHAVTHTGKSTDGIADV